MKHYKSPDGDVFAYELDGSQDHLIPESFVQITGDEAAVLSNGKQQAAFDSMTYAEKRSCEYPPMSDYLDGIVKGDQAQIAKYIADCQAVKAKYPKTGV